MSTTVVTKETATYFAFIAINKLLSTLNKTPEISNINIAKAINYPDFNVTINSPLFVTWNIIDTKTEEHELRGCIGNFSNLKLPEYVKKYSLISALEDSRFSPMNINEIKQIEKNKRLDLQCSVTILHNFENITNNPLDWIIGKHGIRLSFSYKNRHFSSTFLPEVATEQGWNKRETMDALIRKAGIPGHIPFDDESKINIIEVERYSGVKGAALLSEFKSITL